MKLNRIIVLACWFAFLLTLLLVTSGCSSKKSFTSAQTVKDSTWVKKTVKPFDTTVVIPANRARIAVDFNALEGKPVKSTSKNLTATLSREGNTVIAECDQEQLEMIITLQKELLEVYRLKETTQKDTETVVETIRKTPWYLVPFLWLGAIALLYIIFRVIKSYFTPVKTIV